MANRWSRFAAPRRFFEVIFPLLLSFRSDVEHNNVGYVLGSIKGHNHPTSKSLRS
jgi:hypothetical protein